MERILKVVEGPMKGAEIALVAGTRVKVGSGDGCDIVIADAALAECAFELDVADDAVTLALPDGTAAALPDFEIRDFGSTSVAIGPAEGAWEELRRRPAETPEPEPKEAAAEEPAKGEAAAAAEKPAESEDAPGRSRWLLVLAVILLLLVVAVALWLLWPRVRETARGWAGRDRAASSVAVASASAPTLDDIAAAHGLKLAEEDGRRVLSGNLRRRAERLSVRALALAADPMVRLDLSDDQSLKAAAEETLFVLTGGRLGVASATNRTVSLAGSVATPQELESIRKALVADVPHLAHCDFAGVRQAIPLSLSRPFSVPHWPRRETPATNATNAAPAKAEVVVERIPAAVPAAVQPAAPIAVSPSAPAGPQLAVAGILARPYPCVVLKSGARFLEGSVIEGLVLRRIEPDTLVFEGPDGEIVWRP